MDFARHQFVNQRTAGDGSSVGDHMAVVARHRGVDNPLDAGPACPPEIAYLWGCWNELHEGRSSGGMSLNPISWADIEAYSRVLDERLEPWEARAIRAVDNAYMTTLLSDGAGGL